MARKCLPLLLALCLLLAGCSGTAPDGDTAAPQTTPQ